MKSTTLRLFAFAAATAMAAAAAKPQNHPGDQSHWSLDFTARMEQGSTPPMEVHLSGEWTSTISALHPGSYDAQLQLTGVHCIGDAAQKAPPAAVASLEARLSRPFWATYSSDGRLAEMHFYRDSTTADRNLLQTIATELQLVRPPVARTSWTAEERDGAGEYSALYLMQESGHLVKSKLKYTYTDGVAGARAEIVHVVIDKSEIAFSLTPSQDVAEASGTNSIRMDLTNGTTEHLAAITQFHLTNLRTGQAPELIGSLDRARLQVVDSPIITQRRNPTAAQAEADDRLLDGYDTDRLLAAAFTSDSTGPASADRLAALFRRRPEAASKAATLLLRKGGQRTVTNAMGAAASPSAVTVLSGIAHNSSLSEDLRVDAILAFVQMQHPTAEAMRVPHDLVHDSNPGVRTAARMITGALARAGRSTHEAEAEAIDASLIALYRDAGNVREKSDLLGALGNSVGPTVVPVIEEALRDARIPVRAAAARALRLADDATADRLLATTITSDRDAAVRSDAIFATRFRHPLPEHLAQALVHAASDDTANFVRSDAVAVLRQNLTASVEISEALERIAAQDPDPGIRRQARAALASHLPGASAHP